MSEIDHFQRFNVVGSSGSGKSTLGRRLAEVLDLDYVEIDAVFWQENWTEPEDDEFLPALSLALSGDGWVVDGNYARSVPIKWQRVQAVIWLDLPYWQIFWQVLVRTIRRSVNNEVLWAGNRESLGKAFLSRDSILLWSLTNLRRVRRRYEEAMADPSLGHIKFIRLRSRREVSRFLKSLEH